MLTVLSVAFPLVPVTPDAVGGAEQMLAMLDSALVEHGHQSIVIACEGSITRGTLMATPRPIEPLGAPAGWERAHEHHRAAIRAALRRWPVDLVHMHGVDFHRYLPDEGPPVLATLHLPPSWYPDDVFHIARRRTYLSAVSHTQGRAWPPGAPPPFVIPNGIPVERYEARVHRRELCAAMGRICPEKGFHLALDAARLARRSLLLAGHVFPFEEHVRYWESEIVPRLDPIRRHIGPLGFRGKRRLLCAARCLLAPSLAPETSSLVCMEALACGTPVIAFDSGALGEIVEDGRTGFLVHDEYEMAQAIDAVSAIDSRECRIAAHERFSSDACVRAYLELYSALADRTGLEPAAVDAERRIPAMVQSGDGR